MANPVTNPAKAKKSLESHPLVRLAVSLGATFAGVLGVLELAKIFKGQ